MIDSNTLTHRLVILNNADKNGVNLHGHFRRAHTHNSHSRMRMLSELGIIQSETEEAVALIQEPLETLRSMALVNFV